MLERSISTANVFALLTIAAATISTAEAATHLQQPTAATHVTLVTKDIPNGGPANICPEAGFKGLNFFRVTPDGTTETTAFDVPRTQSLVVTDVEWLAHGGLANAAPFIADVDLHMDITLVKAGVPASGNVVYSSPMIDVDSRHVKSLLGATDNLTSGFTVGHGVSICPRTHQQNASGNFAVRTYSVVLHGYLFTQPLPTPAGR
jgi:hypothetical protein